jgi:hypothetical protein
MRDSPPPARQPWPQQEIEDYLLHQAAVEGSSHPVAAEELEPAAPAPKKRKLASGAAAAAAAGSPAASEGDERPKTDAAYVLRLAPRALKFLQVGAALGLGCSRQRVQRGALAARRKAARPAAAPLAPAGQELQGQRVRRPARLLQGAAQLCGSGGATWAGAARAARPSPGRRARLTLHHHLAPQRPPTPPTQKNDELLPGTAGISLRPDEWRKLAAALPDMIAAEQVGDTDYCLQLAPLRKAAVSQYKCAPALQLQLQLHLRGPAACALHPAALVRQPPTLPRPPASPCARAHPAPTPRPTPRGTTKLDVREYYEAGGELKPTKKGAALDGNMLQTLAANLQVGQPCWRIGARLGPPGPAWGRLGLGTLLGHRRVRWAVRVPVWWWWW